MGFRDYYDKYLEFLYNEELKYYQPYTAINTAKQRLRMYANLFNRDMRKLLLNKNSSCLFCNTQEKLSIDHIIPISKGGLNIENNVQILCIRCNIIKQNK